MGPRYEHLGKYETMLWNIQEAAGEVWLKPSNIKFEGKNTNYCPICRRLFIGYPVHTRFECDWLGAVITVSIFDTTYRCTVTRADPANRMIYFTVKDDEGHSVEFGGTPDKLRDLYVIKRAVSEDAQAIGLGRGKAGKWTYR